MWRKALETALDNEYDLWRSGQRKELLKTSKTLKNWINEDNTPSKHTLEQFLQIRAGTQRTILDGDIRAITYPLTFSLEATREIYRQYLIEQIKKNSLVRYEPIALGNAESSHIYGIQPAIEHLAKKICDPNEHVMLSLEGMGGSGKSTHAFMIVQQLKVLDNDILLKGKYPFDGIIWVTMQLSDKAMTNTEEIRRWVLNRVGNYLGLDRVSGEPLDAYRERMIKVLAQERHLIIIDNIEQCVEIDAIIEDLHRLFSVAQILLTSRENLSVLHNDIDSYSVQDISVQDAHDLLCYHLNLSNMTITYEQVGAIYAHTGGNPLALLLVAGLLADNLSIADVIDVIGSDGYTVTQPTDIVTASHGFVEARQKMLTLFKRIYQRIWENLSQPCRELYIALADIPITGIYHKALQMYLDDIQEVYDASTPDSYRQCIAVLRRHYIIFQSGNVDNLHYMMHELTRSFIKGAFNEHEAFDSSRT